MPNYKGHIAGGMVTYCLTYYCIMHYISPTWFTSCEWLLFTIAGALFPDVDTKSKGQKYYYLCFLFISSYFFLTYRYFAASVISLASFAPLMVRHRGLTHQWWFIVAMPLSLVLSSYMWRPLYVRTVFFDALFFIVGASSHLFLDKGLSRF